MVEEDLAEVFGRGQVTAELEAQFKDAVKIEKFTLLSQRYEIRLNSGPGLIMRNAFRDRQYLAMAIQLSLLTWMHDREELAAMLAQSMAKRFETGVEGAALDPGHEGITSKLAVCSS